METMQKNLLRGLSNMKSTNEKLTIHAQNFGYINISI
jgi:hypothetical protein